jgi:mannose-1-phosphate guanylyltransferase
MLHAVVMAGGSGTRFWPLSRQDRPKQFLALTGGAPLLVETVKRLKGMKTWVVCGKSHAPSVKKLVKQTEVVVEPQARNTAPAIALATAHVAHRDPEATIAVLPSDQHVADVSAFRLALESAAKVAALGYIVTLGIKPTRPDTGYGYIRVGEPLGEARSVRQFVEKPDLPTAQGYLQSGEYLWNAGMFVFRAPVMLKAFEHHMPELHAALTELRGAIGTRHYQSRLARLFPKMPATSIDYGIAERAPNMAVVPGSFGWSDVGSFNALPEVRTLDEHGNVRDGEVLAIDCKDCVVLGSPRSVGKRRGGERLVAVVGMNDVVVIDSPDALLVLPKAKSQDVRKVVEQLKRSKKLSRYL